MDEPEPLIGVAAVCFFVVFALAIAVLVVDG